jgi:hypothetical protein
MSRSDDAGSSALGLRTLGVAKSPVAGILTLLIAIDVVLIAFHLSMSYVGRPGGPLFDLGADRSYSEFYQYVKDVWAILILAVLALRRRAGVYVAWGLVCAYFLLDDALQLHEHAGWAIRDMVPGKPGAAVHLGELAFVAGIGLVLLAIVAVTHLRADRRDRAVSTVLLVLFSALIFFGIVVDAVHHLLFPGPQLRVLFTTIEDGGELVVLSLIVAFLFAVAYCGHEPRIGGRLQRLVGRDADLPAESPALTR